MQNSTRYLKDLKSKLNPSDHKEVVKINGDRTLQILVTKVGSVESRIIDLVKRKIK